MLPPKRQGSKVAAANHISKGPAMNYVKQQPAFSLNRDQKVAYTRLCAFLDPLQTSDKFFLLSGYAGTGKEQPIRCRVQTALGSKRLGSLKIGDKIYGRSGKLTTVTGIYPQGIKPCYKITFRDNTSTHCGLDHLWQVTDKKGSESVVKLSTLIERGITNSAGYKFRIPICAPVQYEKRELPIHPYVMGVLLGDGSFRGKRMSITCASFDLDIMKRVESLERKFKFTGRFTGENCKQYIVTDPGVYGNRFTKIIKDLGLCNLYSGEKFIPNDYLLSSVEDRWELLRGLMDTDGCCKTKGNTTFSTTSKKLKHDVKRLVQSLGGIAIMNKASCMNIKTFENPFWLTRKANNWRLSALNGPVRGIKSIKYVGEEEQMCISVSAKDHLYLTDNFIVTHNTFLLKKMFWELPKLAASATAPTNKATKVIKRTLNHAAISVECKTIYSMLGIKMVSDEDRLVLEFPSIPTDLRAYDVIYVDESSMLNRALLQHITGLSGNSSTKWVFLGDKAQLPPVGERNSPVWKLDCPKAYLTKVERYDNEILELATHVRKQVTAYPNVDLQLGSHHGSSEGVWKFRRAQFLHNLSRYAERGDFSEPDSVCAVAWRNRTVEDLNAVIRRAIFGSGAARSRWLVGDRISIGEPITEQGCVIAHIEDEGTILSSEVVQHTIYKEIKVYYLVVQIDDGATINLHVVHEESEPTLQIHLNAWAAAAKADRSKWKYFWMMRNSFHRVRYGYAKTAHRVQGSTYENVFCDTTDILANSNTREALRCLYVATTRATTKLILT